MSRTARRRSTSGMYLVLVQGPHRSEIFENGLQKLHYIGLLQKYYQEGKVRLYAYCFFDNEAYFVIEEEEDNVSEFMRRIGISYVHWYNATYKKEGSLFRGRYVSYPVEEDITCIRLIRYIHQLPVKRNLAAYMDLYPFSSYAEYTRDKTAAIDTSKLRECLGDWKYSDYMELEWKEEGTFVAEQRPVPIRKNDREAEELIMRRLGGRPVRAVARLTEPEMVQLVRELRYEDHLPVAQICRITKLGKRFVNEVRKPENSKEEGALMIE
ncbi:MAG: hypothetical protein IJK56_01790 [Firmicutes bacterium]|nr:hypothetical protein [Bacillota bacterium]